VVLDAPRQGAYNSQGSQHAIRLRQTALGLRQMEEHKRGDGNVKLVICKLQLLDIH
jgi:hypothetical protein